jgi:hypothetical protein
MLQRSNDVIDIGENFMPPTSEVSPFKKDKRTSFEVLCTYRGEMRLKNKKVFVAARRSCLRATV